MYGLLKIAAGPNSLMSCSGVPISANGVICKM